MASNYTENYSLCQWEATDQVLRTEFNEDNQKVDTALNGLADTINTNTSQLSADLDAKTSQLSATLTARVSELTNARRTDLLLDETLSSDRSSVSLSLAEIDLDEYFRLDLVVHSASSSKTTHLYMRFNGLSSTGYCPLNLVGASTSYLNYIELLPYSERRGTMFFSIWGEGINSNSIIWMRHGASPTTTDSFILNGGRFDQLSYNKLTSLYIYPSAPGSSGLVIKAGTRFRIYGLR